MRRVFEGETNLLLYQNEIVESVIVVKAPPLPLKFNHLAMRIIIN